jgi:hypothetical protein
MRKSVGRPNQKVNTMNCRRCSLTEACQLQAIAARAKEQALLRAFASIKTGNRNVAVFLHEALGFDPLISAQLADIVLKAMDHPPDDCVACERVELAA